jgi:predicted DNA-binding transcriptional regulator YafY
MESVDRRNRLAASSRDGHLALRRVERQLALIERLHAARGERMRLAELAHDLGVSLRTVARDVERLRLSGVPLDTHQGRGGGVSLLPMGAVPPILFDLPEVAALMSSLAVLGPSVSESATSAMRKLAQALDPANPPTEPP